MHLTDVRDVTVRTVAVMTAVAVIAETVRREARDAVMIARAVRAEVPVAKTPAISTQAQEQQDL